MKFRSSFLIIIIYLFPDFCGAQDLNKIILMTVNGDKIQAGEFIRMYKKSKEPGNTLDIDAYMQQFTVFKLKVADALNEGYDTTASFRNELNGYRNQLVQNYLTDTQTKDKLLQKAYQRSLTEINAWHILIALPQEASPEDTFKSISHFELKNNILFQIIINILKQYIVFKLKVADALKEGYDTTRAFRNELNGYRNQLAQSYLTDTQTKENLLKNAYHRSLTEINAWHILIALPQEASPEDTLKALKKASDIRERIIKGEPFESVARGTSDDKSVKINGGNLGYFSVFQMIMPFEDAAYSLKKGTVSMPVLTPYGYHIIMA